MRIISGALGGRVLKTPEGRDCRPAMGRVREALFSMLEARGIGWPGLRVLDLFAGCGSLAFEALSRGAASALMVENSRTALRCISENAERLNLADRVRLAGESVPRFLKRAPAETFGLVFLDPPYRRNLAASALQFLAARGWLAEGAFVAAEIETGSRLAPPAAFTPLAERAFGQTRILLWGVSTENT